MITAGYEGREHGSPTAAVTEPQAAPRAGCPFGGVIMTFTLEPQNDDDARTPAAGFDVQTLRSDDVHANLTVSGHLDAGGAVVLAEVIEGHLRAGRRFLRLHLGGIESLSQQALAVIATAHDRLLARRGTMILTGVGPGLETTLRAATPASPLLLLSPTAAERLTP
jgi:anti-anti-sigma regulatory factor